MKFSRIPGWAWMLAVLGAGVLLGGSPFWLLAIGCAMAPGGC